MVRCHRTGSLVGAWKDSSARGGGRRSCIPSGQTPTNRPRHGCPQWLLLHRHGGPLLPCRCPHACSEIDDVGNDSRLKVVEGFVIFGDDGFEHWSESSSKALASASASAWLITVESRRSATLIKLTKLCRNSVRAAIAFGNGCCGVCGCGVCGVSMMGLGPGGSGDKLRNLLPFLRL